MNRATLLLSILSFQAYYIVKGDYYAINWTEASVVGLGMESHFQDPAVTPLAPCPCDLSSNHCDVHCCCDQDCTSYDKSSFPCLGGLEGGQQTPQDLDYNCNYRGPYSPEWHSTLCYITSNNPYLGLFFKKEPGIQEFLQYVARVRSPKYSYESSGLQTDGIPYDFHYVAEASVETAFRVGEELLRSPLSLPQPVLNGICVDSIPIHFLESFRHQCSMTLSQGACENDLTLSSASYLQAGEEMDPDIYDNFPSVISDLITLETINATAKYLCLRNTLKFVKINGLSKTARRYLRDRWDVMDEYFEECYVKKVPVYNDISQMCENVVLSVKYTIGWKGPRITEVDVEIVLGDVPVSLEGVRQNFFRELDGEVLDKSFPNKKKKNTVSHKQPFVALLQDFETLFHYTGSVLVSNETSQNQTSNNETLEEELDNPGYKLYNITERSGNPGYNIGRPLIAGFMMYNTTDEENSTQDSFLYVDINDATGLFIWQPDATSKCSAATTEEVVFGVNMFSSCMYSLTEGYNCEEVREEIISMMSQLIQADVVSKMGSPNITIEEFFLPIIIMDTDASDVADTAGCPIPTGLQHEVIYRNIVDPGSPAHHVYQIIGISTRFQSTDIVMDPRRNETLVMLSSSVVYLNSPKPSKLSRFWEVMEDRWCAGGTCWRELFYPWTHGADATHGIHNEFTVNLMKNSALIVLLSLPIFFFVFQKTLYVRF